MRSRIRPSHPFFTNAHALPGSRSDGVAKSPSDPARRSARSVQMSRRTLPLALAISAALAAASPALAAISSPPAFPREITVFPERDFAVVDLWPAHQDFRMDVLRNGVIIGTAFGTTDAAGLAEVNHPGGFCWTGFTPDILPGDTV